MMRYLLIASFALFFGSASAQCCASGCCTPGTANFGVLGKGHLLAFSFYKHNYSDQFYKGDAQNDLKYYRNIYYDFTGINLSYGLTSKFTLQGDIGYFLNKTQNYYAIGGYEMPSLAGKGLGDAGIYLKANFYNTNSVNLVFGGGVKIPTGEFNQYIKGVRLPIEVQSGTGAYAGALLLNAMIKPFPDKSRVFNINSRTEFSGINPLGYQFGVSNVNILSYTFRLYRNVVFLAMVRSEFKDCDYTYNVVQLNPEPEARYALFNSGNYSDKRHQVNTGCIRFFASPGIAWSFGKGWNLAAYGDLPVYQYYNGLQFGAKYAVSLSLSKLFELHKHTEPELTAPPSQNE